MKPNVWSAWWREEFSPDVYLYHYTTFDSALKIIYSDRLRFSPLSETNDTAEQKLRILYPLESDKENISKFEEYWSKWTANSKLLCFSQDYSKNLIDATKVSKDIFDVRGRGFALPRMWAQYASNHNGVCLILKKDLFLSKVKEAFPESINKEVQYFDWAEKYKIAESEFKNMIRVIEHNSSTGYAPDFLRNNPSFAEYLYFMKLKDWEGEREYRILIPSDNKDNKYLFIEETCECLAGVVIGEKMDEAKIAAIKKILPDSVKVRRITFESSKCSVCNVNNI